MERNKILGLTAGLVGFGLICFLMQNIFLKQPSFDNRMMQLASNLNKNCPIMVDEETRLDNSISLPGNVFQYNYTLINIERENIVISEIEDYIRPLILNNIKTNPDLKAFRDNEVTMAYDYKDKFGVYLFKLAFTSDQYT